MKSSCYLSLVETEPLIEMRYWQHKIHGNTVRESDLKCLRDIYLQDNNASDKAYGLIKILWHYLKSCKRHSTNMRKLICFKECKIKHIKSVRTYPKRDRTVLKKCVKHLRDIYVNIFECFVTFLSNRALNITSKKL